MTSPLCPPCSRLHELVREWNDAGRAWNARDRNCDDETWERLFRAMERTSKALREAAQQLPAADANCPAMDARRFAVLPQMTNAILWKKDIPLLGSLHNGYDLETLRAWCDEAIALMSDKPTTPQTDPVASIAERAEACRHPLLYALIQSGADVCAAIEAVLTERK